MTAARKFLADLSKAGRNPPEVLELVEEPFDEVPFPVKPMIDGALGLPVARRWDVGAASLGFDQIDQRLPVVATVADKSPGRRQPLKHGWRSRLVRGLARCQQQFYRQSTLIHDGVIRTPFLSPAACWWVRMIELSMNCSDCGDCAANVPKIFSPTPPLLHQSLGHDLDRAAYRRRNVIERLFNRLKNWRRIATRYDCLAENYLAAIALVSVVIAWG
ncbi:hypothetical protein MSR1_28180 [Magnetospirillum gryphiswaldense MSR-1]|nr:hypothetical protein MSR1_28180 [Magnetospirillum gryphiswaldense MSR-1]AVM79191.1 hypothetical protein MSR1L_28180 [Magnetospirillum gryphiswaldense]